MKKNISINISGVIFHIEEDGYDQLKNYLDSISIYFSSFEDNKEIIADIENRIAEIFYSKLNETKQVITSEDVVALIATMGTISDFQAIEEEEDKATDSSYRQSSGAHAASDASSQTHAGSKRLYRDTKRKLLGGVAAGIANYLMIDPLWIRLLIVALFFGIFFVPEMSGFTAIAYFILWIVLPEREILEENEKVKKLFRNPEERVIGGVCSGIAAYFGADVILIRLLFVIGIFLGGSTIVLYLILWIITPEARTLTERMKMQGEPVTLSNIEQNIKKNLNVKEDEDENVLTKILLFPFRVIAVVFTAIGKMLGPLLIFIGQFVRILVGILLIFFPVILLIAFLGIAGSAFGWIAGFGFMDQNLFPFEVLINGLPKYAVVAVTLVAIIPLIALVIIGASLLAKRRLFHPAMNWSLGGLMILAVLIAAFAIPAYLNDFKREGKYEEEKIYTIPAKTLILKANPNNDVEYNKVDVILRGHDGEGVKVVEKFRARGSSRKDAAQNAQMISYRYTQEDSTFTFDWNFQFEEEAAFKGQSLDIFVYIPYGKEFIIGEDLGEVLRSHNYFGIHEVEGNKWVAEREGMKCLTCPEGDDDFNFYRDDEFDFHSDDNFNFHFDSDEYKSIDKDDNNVIQAEDYHSSHGVETENTSDIGGGQNLGYINSDDWISYRIDVPATSTYLIRYRVSSQDGEGRIRLESLGGASAYGAISIPHTGDWQNWKTIAHKVELKKGKQEIILVAEEGGFNINWLSITSGEAGFTSNISPDELEEDKYDNNWLSRSLFNKSSDTDASEKSQTYNFADFTGLSVSGFFIINVMQGNEYKVKLTGNQRDLEDIEVKVQNNDLEIDLKSDENNWTGKNHRVKIDVVMPTLNEIDFNGLTNSNITGFKSDFFKVNLNGAATSSLNIMANNLDMDISGGAHVKLRGQANYAKAELNGATHFEGFDFKIKEGEFDISGASATKLFVTDYLKIDAEGPCDIRYKGDPKLVEHTAFLSKIRRED
ncbi:MAG TPA: DUF2807 domain-containing protein [Cytophagales bacterium]|nr:DUF2807 domain-containing protein [Cytophagales bacterium]